MTDNLTNLFPSSWGFIMYTRIYTKGAPLAFELDIYTEVGIDIAYLKWWNNPFDVDTNKLNSVLISEWLRENYVIKSKTKSLKLKVKQDLSKLIWKEY